MERFNVGLGQWRHQINKTSKGKWMCFGFEKRYHVFREVIDKERTEIRTKNGRSGV